MNSSTCNNNSSSKIWDKLATITKGSQRMHSNNRKKVSIVNFLDPFVYSHCVVTINLNLYCREEMALGIPTD